jgi:addiction module HigA family antidote
MKDLSFRNAYSWRWRGGIARLTASTAAGRMWNCCVGDGGLRCAPFPASPGGMLEKECLGPLGLTKYRPAEGIGVPAQRVGDIVGCKGAVKADAELRFCHCFGSNPRLEVTQPQLHCLDLGARGVSDALARWRHER